MFKIAILLRFIDIIKKSWYLLQRFGWNLKPLSKKCKTVTVILSICLSYLHQFLHKRQFCGNNAFIIYKHWSKNYILDLSSYELFSKNVVK